MDFQPQGEILVVSSVPTFPWKEDSSFLCLEVPILIGSPEVRYGNTLGLPSLPPSREPTLGHTNVLSLPYENPHSYTNLSPLTTFDHDKKSNYLKLTATEIDSPPANQSAGQKRPGCDQPPKCTERMIITGGSSVITWYAITTYLYFGSVFFFSFFFLLGTIFVIFLTKNICGIFSLSTILFSLNFFSIFLIQKLLLQTNEKIK